MPTHNNPRYQQAPSGLYVSGAARSSQAAQKMAASQEGVAESLAAVAGQLRVVTGRLGASNRAMAAANRQGKDMRQGLGYAAGVFALLGGSSVLLASRVGALDGRFYDFQVTLRQTQILMGQAIHQTFAPFYPVLEGINRLLAGSDGELNGFGGAIARTGVALVALTAGLKALNFFFGDMARRAAAASGAAAVLDARLKRVAASGRLARLAVAGLGPLGLALTAITLATALPALTGGGGGQRGGGRDTFHLPARPDAPGGAGARAPTAVNVNINTSSILAERDVVDLVNEGVELGTIRLRG